jgi:hypothetical protein
MNAKKKRNNIHYREANISGNTRSRIDVINSRTRAKAEKPIAA